VLATNFGKPASLFEKFPQKDVFITGKPWPRNPKSKCGPMPGGPIRPRLPSPSA
jgi:hypothetical protein